MGLKKCLLRIKKVLAVKIATVESCLSVLTPLRPSICTALDKMKRTVRDDYTVPDSPEHGGDTRELIGNRCAVLKVITKISTRFFPASLSLKT